MNQASISLVFDPFFLVMLACLATAVVTMIPICLAFAALLRAEDTRATEAETDRLETLRVLERERAEREAASRRGTGMGFKPASVAAGAGPAKRPG